MPILGLVICGAPLAARAHDLVKHARKAGWDVSVVPTDAASAWLEVEADISAHVTRFRTPDQPKRPRPDALVVCPLTFNSGSKWALGIADNRPMSLMCESLGAGLPIVAVPMVNDSLWNHPAWPGHVRLLEDRGVVMLDPDTGKPGAKAVRSGTGDDVTKRFDPAKVLVALAQVAGHPSP